MRSLVLSLTFLVASCSGSSDTHQDTASDPDAAEVTDAMDTSPDAPIDVETDSIDAPSEDGAEACTGCWIDPSTGYMWENPPLSGAHSWDNAVAYCDALSLNGFGPGEWRLPTISEQRAIIRGCPSTETDGACRVTDTCTSSTDCLGAECEECSELGGPGDGGCYWDSELEGTCAFYWSSTPDTHVPTPFAAWGVFFNYAGIVGYTMTVVDENHVRCVRPGT